MNDSFSLVTRVLKHFLVFRTLENLCISYTLSWHLKFFIMNLSSFNSLGCNFRCVNIDF